MNARHPVTGQWAVVEIVVCPGMTHAWRRWAGEEPLVEVRDWSVIRAYRRVPPSRLRSDLTAAVKEIGVLKVRKSTSFKEIVQWAIDDLPEAAPNHPRSAEAKAMATYYWRSR